jgi:tryprostatin B 6-hydroxylase
VSVLAIAVHHFIFRKGEWHLQAPHIFAIWALSAPILFVTETLLSSSQSWRALARNAVLTTSCFTIATLSSIAVYRLFFHRLGDFPGPALARVSKLWHTVQCQDSRNHLVLDKLHQQYGDFVRTGKPQI